MALLQPRVCCRRLHTGCALCCREEQSGRARYAGGNGGKRVSACQVLRCSGQVRCGPEEDHGVLEAVEQQRTGGSNHVGLGLCIATSRERMGVKLSDHLAVSIWSPSARKRLRKELFWDHRLPPLLHVIPATLGLDDTRRTNERPTMQGSGHAGRTLAPRPDTRSLCRIRRCASWPVRGPSQCKCLAEHAHDSPAPRPAMAAHRPGVAWKALLDNAILP